MSHMRTPAGVRDRRLLPGRGPAPRRRSQRAAPAPERAPRRGRAGGSARKNAGGPGGRAGRAGWRAFGGELALGVDADLRQHLPPAGPAGISAEWMHRANRSVVIPTC